MKIHTGERLYKCKVCGERLYRCEVCCYAYSQSVSLKTHMKMHAGESVQVLGVGLCILPEWSLERTRENTYM
ncbi:hypothetical protein DPMN_143792 [Dreissena polymorpha]|uniref:C2H2-type domain-containing protein n=1 Tax=Dreissena polymorpha TaxID=45954 RepID=A0A9D4JKC4_DREPO|nr:hypothetical protein DPMN_143792 [Dreissena polymorpha]